MPSAAFFSITRVVAPLTPGLETTPGVIRVLIALLDVVFYLDSISAAVGLAGHLSIMAIAIIIAVAIMMLSARSIGDFVGRHPTVKMLALSFLLIIGMTLMVKGFDVHVPRGYIYFAMAFSVMVEMFNPRTRTRQTSPIKLHRKLEQGQNPV